MLRETISGIGIMTVLIGLMLIGGSDVSPVFFQQLMTGLIVTATGGLVTYLATPKENKNEGE